LTLFAFSDLYKTVSSSQGKSAVKRKQREFLTDSEGTKHRRSRAGVSAEDVVMRRDWSVNTSMVECSADDTWTDTEAKAVQLRLLLEQERKQTDDFEAYLRRALSDSHCGTASPANSCRPSSQETAYNSSDTQCSLSEQISRLQDTVVSEREANRLFELQLLQICLYD